MWSLYIFRSYLRREYAWIADLYTVIIDGDAIHQIMFLPLAMTQRVYNSFAESLIWYFKPFFPLKTAVRDFTAQVKMLETECQTRVKQVKEISLHTHLIDELILVRTQETSHLDLEIVVLIHII